MERKIIDNCIRAGKIAAEVREEARKTVKAGTKMILIFFSIVTLGIIFTGYPFNYLPVLLL